MQRLSTGSADLDLVLGGGLPAGTLQVLAGAPGTGKTILAQQICFANATPERKALYYTTWSEPHDKLLRHLSPFGFFDRSALGDSVEFIHLGDLAAARGDQGIESVATELVRRSFEARPALVVVDSSKALHDVAGERGFRQAVYDLASRIGFSDAVLLFVGEYTPEEIENGPEFAVADGIVRLTSEPDGAFDRRWLRVIKMRGSSPLTGRHSFEIGPGGFDVFPRFEALRAEHGVPAAGRLSTGVPRLDELMDGGVPGGDSTFVVGPSGVGKTVLALGFVARGVADGERCLYVSFQEDEQQLLDKAASFGVDLRPALASGLLTVAHVRPVEVNLDAVGTLLRRELADGSVRRVVLDSLAELRSSISELERFPAYVWALTGFSRAAGATILVTHESSYGPSSSDYSFLFQNAVRLRYVEDGPRTARTLNVLKMRNSDHAKAFLRYEVGPSGIEIRGEAGPAEPGGPAGAVG